ncbi:MAG: CRISPR-associated helicase Cas3' [Armatimonadota bacterium]
MIRDEPLAKKDPNQTITEHTAQVWEAAQTMLEALCAWLPPGLLEHARDAVWLHDVGKAAEGFQRMLRTGERWKHRHELLSASIALAVGCSPEVVLAIATHHCSLNDNLLRGESGLAIVDENWEKHGKAQWRKLCREMAPNWEWLTHWLKEQGYEELPDTPEQLPDLRVLLSRYERPNVQSMSRWEQYHLTLLRGLLMAADHLASGHHVSLQRLPQHNWRFEWKEFQSRMAETTGDVLLEAPTGSGKTEAAILWAWKNRLANERILYLLPTQASINAMVERLRNCFGENHVAPVHARVLYQEFQRHFEGDYKTAAEAARRQSDLYRQFYAPIKVLTPYQIVKHLFGGRYFEIGLSEMVGACVIVDEIHAYDARVQAILEKCLQYIRERLHVHICLMSATFPTFLKRRLEQIAPFTCINGFDDDSLHHPRHRLRLLACRLEDTINDIVQQVHEGKRVLVVCNHVKQAQQIFQNLQDVMQDDVRLLHARFTYGDRNRIEDAVRKNLPAVLVATQVVEVSLDLDFDTLYTEAAPVDDLLQRFGRVNRKRRLKEPADVYVCAEYDAETIRWIYDTERVQASLCIEDGTVLDDETAFGWLEKVYAGGFNEREQKVYEETLQAMDSVLNGLTPLYEAEHGIDFDSLFDSVDVVPAALQQEYLSRIAQKQWLHAHNLMIPLRYSTLHGLKSKGLVGKAGDTVIVHLQYDANRGLLPSPEEQYSWIV